MHDVQLEDRLRRALRDDADSLPFTITPDRIEIRLAARRRAAFNQRLALLAAAGLAVVAVGVGAFLLNRDNDQVVPTSPSPSPTVDANPSPQPVGPSLSPDASSAPPSAEPTPASTPRTSEPFGASDEAVVVKIVGDPRRPDHIDVSLVRFDAAAFETNPQAVPLAGIAGSTIPDGYELVETPPKSGPGGWLALGATQSASGNRAILIWDLRDPNAEPWLVPGALETAAWNAGSTLAVADRGAVQLHDTLGRTSSTIALAADVLVSMEDDNRVPYQAPMWLADGSGFAAQRGDDFGYENGAMSLDGTFRPESVPAPVLQVTGLERRWGADNSDLSTGCPTEGGPPGCGVWTSTDGPTTTWYVEDMGLGDVGEEHWDADGTGIWLTVNRTSVSPSTWVLMHAEAPGVWVDIVEFTFELPPDQAHPVLVGIRDAEPTADNQVFLFGSPTETTVPMALAVSADGARTSVGDLGQFAGWAGAQPPYPVR